MVIYYHIVSAQNNRVTYFPFQNAMTQMHTLFPLTEGKCIVNASYSRIQAEAEFTIAFYTNNK